MKAGIHPEVHAVRARCACGNEFDTVSTSEELRLEICGACHPHYTGQKRAMSARGRVQQFEQKYQAVDPEAARAARDKKRAKQERQQSKRRKS